MLSPVSAEIIHGYPELMHTEDVPLACVLLWFLRWKEVMYSFSPSVGFHTGRIAVRPRVLAFEVCLLLWTPSLPRGAAKSRCGCSMIPKRHLQSQN